MPEIKQLDWSKLKPESKDEVKYRVEKPKGYLKYDKNFTKKPKKIKKTKAVDKRIWSDNYDNMQHLKSIRREV